MVLFLIREIDVMPTKRALPANAPIAAKLEDLPAPWQQFAKTIITVNPPSAIALSCILGFIAVVVMKTIHPGLEPYSFLSVLVFLAWRAFGKVGSEGK
jgi:hypothetical protein